MLPAPRGPLGEWLVDRLRRTAGPVGPVPVIDEDPLRGEDFACALYTLYELHYRSFAGVSEYWEWEPSLLALRVTLEAQFERAIIEDLAHAPWVAAAVRAPGDTADRLRALASEDPGPSLSRFLETRAELWQMHEFLIHRSIYHLKEADPHSWAIPRLAGRAKAALVEIQADEYGAGDEQRVHAHLFAKALAAVGLDPRYGAYVDRVPGSTLATVNLMSMFGLHRRLRGAIVGHLAIFEMTSTQPNRRYANGLRRLCAPIEALDFFDEHVEADAVHENIAAHDLAGSLVEAEGIEKDVLFGAAALLRADARVAEQILGAWSADRSSLLERDEHPAADGWQLAALPA